jgi:hypothetical protein
MMSDNAFLYLMLGGDAALFTVTLIIAVRCCRLSLLNSLTIAGLIASCWNFVSLAISTSIMQ